MQHRMAVLVHRVTGGIAPPPSAVCGHHGVNFVRMRRVVAAEHGAARPKYCRLRGVVAIAAPETSRLLLDQHVCPTNTASNKLATNRNDKFLKIEMKVSDDDLDEYGVVNNASYASYIHSGRDVMLEKMGIGVDYWASMGNAMAISELNLKYFSPLKSGDRFVFMVKIAQIKGVRVILEHKIDTLPDRKLVLESRATAVCLSKEFRPTRVFPEFLARATDLFSCKAS